ncbi:uncharacterized protein METZ01_LOCUS467904, partial [marine metagenome]
IGRSRVLGSNGPDSIGLDGLVLVWESWGGVGEMISPATTKDSNMVHQFNQVDMQKIERPPIKTPMKPIGPTARRIPQNPNPTNRSRDSTDPSILFFITSTAKQARETTTNRVNTAQANNAPLLSDTISWTIVSSAGSIGRRMKPRSISPINGLNNQASLATPISSNLFFRKN